MNIKNHMAAITRKHILWSAAFGGLVFFSGVFAKQAAAPSPIEPEVSTTATIILFFLAVLLKFNLI